MDDANVLEMNVVILLKKWTFKLKYVFACLSIRCRIV